MVLTTTCESPLYDDVRLVDHLVRLGPWTTVVGCHPSRGKHRLSYSEGDETKLTIDRCILRRW